MECAVVGKVFISVDAKGSDAVPGFREHKGLAYELSQCLGCQSPSVSTLPHPKEAEAELVDGKFPHGTLLFTLILCHDGEQEKPDYFLLSVFKLWLQFLYLSLKMVSYHQR